MRKSLALSISFLLNSQMILMVAEITPISASSSFSLIRGSAIDKAGG